MGNSKLILVFCHLTLSRSVDIVETGETMKQNGLEVGDTIMESSAQLIANKNSYYLKKEAILALKNKIELT